MFETIRAGNRLTPEQGLELLQNAELMELGAQANQMRNLLNPSDRVSYIIDRNINYTNVCVANCSFCAFYRPPGHEEGYLHEFSSIGEKIQETLDLGGTGILLQGGHNPAIPLDWYQRLLNFIRTDFPSIHVHAFSPSEIQFFAHLYKMELRDVIRYLRDAGLMSIPGGGAEILTERVRKQIGKGKASTKQWLEVNRVAHQEGIRSTATMMYGSLDTHEDIIQHLMEIRNLQDETGGFTAFIPWAFQPGGSELHTAWATGMDFLKVLAVSRLMLDNIRHVQSSWLTTGMQLGQLGLRFGADDMGSIMIEENVVSPTGCRSTTNEEKLKRLIEGAGYTPVKRLTLFQDLPIYMPEGAKFQVVA